MLLLAVAAVVAVLVVLAAVVFELVGLVANRRRGARPAVGIELAASGYGFAVEPRAGRAGGIAAAGAGQVGAVDLITLDDLRRLRERFAPPPLSSV